MRVNVEFRDIPRSNPLDGAVWGSAHTGLLTPKPPVPRPPSPPCPATRDNTGLLGPREGRTGSRP